MKNFLLKGKGANRLTDPQLRLLEIVQTLDNELWEVAFLHGTPRFTLQQSYLVSLLKCSATTVANGIKKLCDMGILTVVREKYGECTQYEYNRRKYRALVDEAKREEVTLISGRNKARRTVTAAEVWKYIKGKSINKNPTLREE